MLTKITIEINEAFAEEIIKNLEKAKALKIISKTEPEMKYSPKQIEANGKTFVFAKKLTTTVAREGEFITIAHKPTGIVAHGKNMQQAVEAFNQYFFALYEGYIHEPLEKLTHDGAKLKHTLSDLVIEVNED